MNCEKTTGYDVIIVGAGLSGLTAAKELKRGRDDLNVLILEATHRIGGRARTLEKGPPIDLGGAWIHGVPTNPLTGIVDNLGFKRVTTQLEVPYYTEKGRVDSETFKAFKDTNEQFEEVLGESARRQHSLAACRQTLSLMKAEQWPFISQLAARCAELEKSASDKAEDYLPSNPELRALLASNSGPLESTMEIDQTSTVDAAEFEADDDALLERGIGTFVETYGKGAPVCLNTPVTNISYGAQGVVVETKPGKRYHARKVIVTVSIGVLKAKKITFYPELPDETKDAIAGLPMGFMQKVIIDFKDQGLLPDKDANSWVLYKGPDDAVMAFVIKPLDKNIAIGFYGGKQAERYEQQCKDAMSEKPLPPERQPCDEQAVQRAREALGNMYGQEVSKAVDKADIYLTRWSLEPWTLGAYTAASPGQWPMREQLAKPIPLRSEEQEEGPPFRLYFAGEACSSPMYNGSLAGAYEAGFKAARLILQHFPKEEPERFMAKAKPAP